jgi:hypothetical protein
MFTFEAVYEAEAYRQARQHDALVYRRQHNLDHSQHPVVYMISLLIGLFR